MWALCCQFLLICSCLIVHVWLFMFDCPYLIAPSVFSNVYLSCEPYAASFSWLFMFDCSCLIVHVWLPLQYSLTFICLVSPMLPVSLDCSCLIVHVWFVHVWLPLQYSLTFICLVSPMLPVSLDCSCLIVHVWLFIFDCPFSIL